MSEYMLELYCLDKYGNSISNLTQWDVNQSISIQKMNYEHPPQFHFCNKNSTEALVVESSITDNLITAEVPNILLQDSIPIFVYIYAYDSEYSAKTDYVITIPVRKRLKPSDYQYVENIEMTSVTVIEQRIKEYINDYDINQKTITFDKINTRESINSGESISTIISKIQKWLTDLDESAFYKVADNLTTITDGFVLNAKQGTELYNIVKDEVTQKDIDNLFSS